MSPEPGWQLFNLTLCLLCTRQGSAIYQSTSLLKCRSFNHDSCITTPTLLIKCC